MSPRPAATTSFRPYTTAELVASRPGDKQRESSRLELIVLLENVRSAYNVGLVFRLCDCVNIRELWLAGITPYPGVSEHATNHIEKTGVGGSLDVLPWRHLDDPVPQVRKLKMQGWSVVALEQGAGSSHWTDVDYSAPLLLVFGHERDGVTDRLLEQADAVAELPVRGITNSLNVALCASAVLYHVMERQLAGG